MYNFIAVVQLFSGRRSPPPPAAVATAVRTLLLLSFVFTLLLLDSIKAAKTVEKEGKKAEEEDEEGVKQQQKQQDPGQDQQQDSKNSRKPVYHFYESKVAKSAEDCAEMAKSAPEIFTGNFKQNQGFLRVRRIKRTNERFCLENPVVCSYGISSYYLCDYLSCLPAFLPA